MTKKQLETALEEAKEDEEDAASRVSLYEEQLAAEDYEEDEDEDE